jgi:hypothetical protein
MIALIFGFLFWLFWLSAAWVITIFVVYLVCEGLAEVIPGPPLRWYYRERRIAFWACAVVTVFYILFAW